MEAAMLLSHYYPACSEPEITLSTIKHTDPFFLTIVLQDNIGGLQILHKRLGHVSPLPEALVVHVGNLMQVNF